MTYKCKLCKEKEFETSAGLWKHNNKYHNTNTNTNTNNNKTKIINKDKCYLCTYCNKEYKHRFSIHETTKIRQCSPTNKKEAYSNYLGVMMLLKEFFEHPEVDFNNYICEKLEEKKIIKDYLLVKN